MMQRNYEEDSGRSSCSAGSVGFNSNVNEVDKTYCHLRKRHHMRTQEASTNTDLKVSVRPRSCIVLSSPEECDPFPSYKLPKNQRKSVINLFNSPRMGGLSNAQSTLDIASSTHIDHALKVPLGAASLGALNKMKMEDKYTTKQINNGIFKRSKPVQRAASRLYRTEGFKGESNRCVGPEFIVRAAQPPKKINIIHSPLLEKKIITVILLNGQRININCDPNTITAGQIFEAVVRSEKYEHSFMLGIAILIGGDFIFLPEDYKLKKIAPESWSIKQSTKKEKIVTEDFSLTVFLRIKIFLPSNVSRNTQGGEWRTRIYLQLRRSIIEGQLTSTIQNLILLAGYALHIEFGEFSYREHGSGDYFLLEHYLPETSITNDMSDIKLRMKRAHESRRGLDKNKAIINYITLAQTFRDYGAHFYSSIWATRDGFCRDVWLAMGPRGITIYSRTSPTEQANSNNHDTNFNHNVSILSNGHGNCSSNEGISSSESCSLPRRHGVKMGTRVFKGAKSGLHNYPSPSHYTSSDHLQNSDVDLNTHSDSDDLCSNFEQKMKHYTINSMKLLPERQYNQNINNPPTAYVIESPKVYGDAFDFNVTSSESCLNGSFYQRLDRMGCVQGERIFVTAILHRDNTKALGLQVAEGSDGNVYIKSITPGGPAETSKKLNPGDQIISVNGQTLLNIKYEMALEILQSAPQTVELIVLQNLSLSINAKLNNIKGLQDIEHPHSNINKAADVEIVDDELLNEEALKTIYALIKLTKDKVISHMKDRNHGNSSQSLAIHKCLSENEVYNENDVEVAVVKDASYQKRGKQKFNTWRGEFPIKPKRRPLSLSIPDDVHLSQGSHDKLSGDLVIKNSSIKSIQSSLNDLDKNEKYNAQRAVALPRNFGLSRKWLGPVRYPVTPCKNNGIPTDKKSAIESEVVRKHFVYGAGDSDDDQIFL
ncbi:FERM and PDZ domain-containing protein 2 [Eumeta japonica]|uniref:FERM and PDZ domain-containing protein 2 n=1 Tax=Eumeta variegata TaxID=151549 RepID=A0A4C1X4D0_EUMVA|nr:FERM and PDZ domain-containing protein 2 [Eumeta japonica]